MTLGVYARAVRTVLLPAAAGNARNGHQGVSDVLAALDAEAS